MRLYRERYTGFNATHSHEAAQRVHGVPNAYTSVKRLLQAAKPLPPRGPRGRPRRRRKRRPCFGEMLHLDGSPHARLALRPTERQRLLTHVLPHALYSDHAGWAFYTPKAGSAWTATRSRRSAALWPAARCFGHSAARGRRHPIAAAPCASRVLSLCPPHPLPTSSVSILTPLRACLPNLRSSKPRLRAPAPA